MRKSLLWIFLIAPFCNISAQGIFRDLTVVQFGDSILINWTLTAGNTCFDMYLQRSDAGAEFETVYSVGGVCGGVDDQYYDFIDFEMLESGVWYQYRVSASNETYISDTAEITFIDAGAAVLFIYPNPAGEIIQLTVDNALNPSFLVEIYSAAGEIVLLQQFPGNLISIPTIGIPKGMYHINVTTRQGEVYSTPVIVL